MDASQFIDALGGTSETATLLGVVPSAVSNAKRAGKLPARWYFRLAGLAQQRGVNVPDGIFEGEAA